MAMTANRLPPKTSPAKPSKTPVVPPQEGDWVPPLVTDPTELAAMWASIQRGYAQALAGDGEPAEAVHKRIFGR